MSYFIRRILFKLVFLVSLGYIRLFGAGIDTITIPSASMGKSFSALLVLPDSHRVSDKRYPVLYLLHGHSGHFTGWYEISTQLKQWADQYQMIIVCPDGDYDSWYIDSPVQKNRKFETFISNELVHYIDFNYKTIDSSASRGISGVSMGGHGAMFLAFKHPDVFGVIGSSSGVLDLLPYSGFWNLQTIIGDNTKAKERLKKYSSFYLLDKIRSTTQKIWIDCGTEDFLIDLSRKFHQKLLDKNIQHVYLEKPGAHTLKYWKDSYTKQILFFVKEFNR